MPRSPLHHAMISAVLLLTLTGCKSDYDRAVEKAKLDAVSTGQPQQVISVDKSGNTTVTVVQPPALAGQAAAVATNTVPAGSAAAIPAGQPDYSNGARPAPGNTVVFSGPKPVAHMSAPASPGTSSSGAAASNNAATTTGTTQSLETSNGAATAAPDSQQATDFVPTDVTIPAGTGLAIRLNQTISVKKSHAGDRFTGALAESVLRNGKTVLPRGTRVNGVVTESHRRGHFKGRSYLGLRLTSLAYQGKTYPIATANLTRTKKGKGKRSAAFIGGGAGLGMLVGGLATGGVGLAVGGLSGGGLGTLLAGVTGNRDISIPAESLVRFRLEDDLTVQPAE